MRLSLLLPLAFFAAAAVAQPPAPQSERARAWWATVSTLAADDMEGREAGSAGHVRASDLVAQRFATLGLQPAGENGTFFQAVHLEERRFTEGASSAALLFPGARAELAVPGDILFRVAGGPPPERVDAPLVFIGYGFHLPEAGHDDLSGSLLRADYRRAPL